MMKMNKENSKILALLGWLVIGVILISGGGQAREESFVTTCGLKFCLNDEEFKFVGVNIADLLSYSHAEMDSVFEKSSGLGIKVIRVYLDNGEELEGLRKKTPDFDHMLTLAEKHNIRIIMTLTWWGGMPQSYGMNFFSDEKAQKKYKEWVKSIITRYKDNPYVFSWELINEPEYFHLHFKGTLQPDDLLQWIKK